ncbi:helix-turn-helix transcriptional regulator [Actinomadura fulvescens]|uniref:Helix-turn-helix transcriptional regulator n=1 Tax=Actinomadura fulvescens TaxID=46160 RepID=A0ABN3QBE9_9ACTN
MPTSSSVQAAREAFGTRLREIRREAGLTGTELARRAGRHQTKVSKLEHAITLPDADDLRAWCVHCDVADQYPELLAKLIATETMWTDWRRLERAGLRQANEAVVPLWERTRHFRIYSSWLVPGPLQAEPYIRALLASTQARRGLVDDIDEATAVRVAKQHVIREGDHRFAIVLEESVLRTRIGGVGVLAEQLRHLLDVMALPSVSLGIIPMDADRSLLRPVEMFFMFDDDQVSAEFVSGWLRVTAPGEIAMYAHTFGLLAELAVHGERARRLVNEALTSLR